MAHNDWLFTDGRHAAAADRIYAAATELMFREGFDTFSVDALAAMTHCSRATIYRHVGGKKDIREAVLTRSAARIVDTVRVAVQGCSGADRVLVAVEVAVAQIRADPVGRLFAESMQHAPSPTWLTTSPAVAAFATELTGLAGNDVPAAQWIARLVLSLIQLPGPDPAAEHSMLTRFVAPAFDHSEK